jgi:hypothetical protein
MSCGCQKRAASNGQSACASCINSLEAKLKADKTAVKTVTANQYKVSSQG